MDYKESVKKACESFAKKELRQKTSTKKNSHPEKEVEKAVLADARNQGFWLHVYESKAAFNRASGRYLKSTALPEGHPDLMGITPCGKPCLIELKAHKKQNTLRDLQRHFLKEAISRGAFALVVDDPLQLFVRYQTWLKSADPKAYLLSLLPT